MSQVIRILTRKSALALCQAKTVAAELKLKQPAIKIELVYTDSIGDKIRGRTDISKGEIKRKWTYELEVGLEEGLGDIAVHCGKDLGVFMSKGLIAIPILEREDPRDIFVGLEVKKFSELKAGARIGTTSTRRKFQLEQMLPGVIVLPYSGNVNTRIDAEHMAKNGVNGAVVAAAGVIRLNHKELVSASSIETNEMVPAMNQGILMAQFCKNRLDLKEILQDLVVKTNALCCTAERACVELLGASCETPIGVYATLDAKDEINLLARTILADGTIIQASSISVDPLVVAKQVADELLGLGYLP